MVQQTKPWFSAKTVCLAVGLIALTPLSVEAQSNPSADQIINQLRPGSSMAGGTRGIRPPAPSTPIPGEPSGSGSASQPIRQAPSSTGREPSVDLTVQFASNSAVLTQAAISTLNELGRALSSSALATYRFRVEGHTDTRGSAELNRTLSERRAKAVVDFLISRFNIDASRLQPVGMGEAGLLVQTPPDTAEPRNRRVTVINLGT